MPAPGEPMWLDEDAEYALEWKRLQNEKCGGCGQSLTETLGVDNENRWEAELFWCDGCRERERAAGKWASGGGDQRGLKVVLHDLDKA